MNTNGAPHHLREAFCFNSGTHMPTLINPQQSVSDTHRKLFIEYLSPHDLKLDPSNPRIHTPKQIRQIARSLETFGFNVPVLADSSGKLVAGHGRVLAARKLELPLIPVIRLEHLDEAQSRAFAIADNKLTENAKWDPLLLGEQFKALSEVGLDFSVEVTGFEISEIDLLIQGLEPAGADGADPADQLPESEIRIPVSKLGHHWVLGQHRVLCGNALDEESFSILMQGQKSAAVFVDPPFNVKIDGHVGGLGKIKHREFGMASGEMTETEFTSFLLRAGGAVYHELKALCVWNKGNGGMGSLYRSQHELVFVFKNGTVPHKSRWKAPHDISLGTTLKQLERLNGRPFRIAGYGWDYSGTIKHLSQRITC